MDKIGAKLQYLKGMADGIVAQGGEKNIVIFEIIATLELMYMELKNSKPSGTSEHSFLPSLADISFTKEQTLRRDDLGCEVGDFEQNEDVFDRDNDVWYDESLARPNVHKPTVMKTQGKVKIEKICKHCGTYISCDLRSDEVDKVRIQCPKCKRFLLPSEKFSATMPKSDPVKFNWDDDSGEDGIEFSTLLKDFEIEVSRQNEVPAANKKVLSAEVEDDYKLEPASVSFESLYEPLKEPVSEPELKKTEEEDYFSFDSLNMKTGPEIESPSEKKNDEWKSTKRDFDLPASWIKQPEEEIIYSSKDRKPNFNFESVNLNDEANNVYQGDVSALEIEDSLLFDDFKSAETADTSDSFDTDTMSTGSDITDNVEKEVLPIDLIEEAENNYYALLMKGSPHSEKEEDQIDQNLSFDPESVASLSDREDAFSGLNASVSDSGVSSWNISEPEVESTVSALSQEFSLGSELNEPKVEKQESFASKIEMNPKLSYEKSSDNVGRDLASKLSGYASETRFVQPEPKQEADMTSPQAPSLFGLRVANARGEHDPSYEKKSANDSLERKMSHINSDSIMNFSFVDYAERLNRSKH